MATMKALLVNPDLSTQIHDVPIPKPGPTEILVKTVVVGANPKDWKIPLWGGKPLNSSDDVAGIVEEVGEAVFDVKKGDRVLGYHYYKNTDGGYGDYTIIPDYGTAKIPDHISFEEAATIPLASLTAAVGLYHQLSLPPPWAPATKKVPLVVYGAATAVGAFTIKLARLSNIHPIIGVVGRGKDFAETLIDRSKGDDLVDYREGSEAVISGIKAALAKNGFESAEYVFDCVSEHGSVVDSAAVVSGTGVITGVLPLSMEPRAKELSPDVNWKFTTVGWVHDSEWPGGSEEKNQGANHGGNEFAYIFLRYMVKGLNEGWFKAHPHELIEGGLNGVEGALKNLKEGKASAVKYVFRVEDTKA